MTKFPRIWGFVSVLTIAPILAMAGCHSAHVQASVENRTGGTIRLLEVAYPSASFGVDHLNAGAIFSNRIKLRGDGAIRVQYTNSDGKPVQIEGPQLAERQDGRINIVLLPGGKADFHPQLTQ